MADGCCYIIVYFMHSYNINIMYVSDVISEAIVVKLYDNIVHIKSFKWEKCRRLLS